MKIVINNNNNSKKTNYISFNKFNLKDIPYLSIKNYFLESTENFYFLFLALIQLSTYSEINLLPAYWSPSGPFATFIPLFLCYLLELISIVVIYFNELQKTYYYNYCNHILVNDIEKPLKEIKIGDILTIFPNTIIPVDGILYNSNDDNNYSKISLSNLNGECDIILKKNISELVLDEKIKINEINVNNIKNYKNSIKLFNSNCTINNKYLFKLDHNYFIPGGSINKGNEFKLIVTEIGKNIRSYTSSKNDNVFNINFINKFVSNHLTFTFVPILVVFCISLVYYSVIEYHTYNVLFVLEKIFQSWILLNGIVPFSIKMILLVNRNLQKYFYSNNEIDYLESSSVDNFPEIKHIITDKTGTITKNELHLTHISYNNKVYFNNNNIKNIPFSVLSKLVLSLHCNEHIYNTEEDRIIGEKIESLGNIIEYNKKNIKIINKNRNLESKFKIIEMNKYKFNSKRKMSSVIYQQIDDNNRFSPIFMITKGSIEKIRTLIIKEELDNYDFIKYKYDHTYPYLRTIAVCYKQLDDFDIKDDKTVYETNNSYHFLSIIGIQDDLQLNIFETISNLKSHKKNISICTGDRKETALYIGEKIGILDNNNYINFNESDKNIENELINKTFIFSSLDINNSLINYNILNKFNKYLLESKNFIAYSLIPKDKKYIAGIFEAHNKKIIAIGDGNNDIPMLQTATLAISINNKINDNVVNNSNISISKFENLNNLLKESYNFYYINYNATYLIFFKTILVNSLIYYFIVFNQYNYKNILFNFYDMQGHHLLWGTIPILCSNFYTNNNNFEKKSLVKKACFYAMVNCALIYYIVFNFIQFTKQNVLFLTILSLNFQFILIYKLNKFNILSIFLSLIIGFIYAFF